MKQSITFDEAIQALVQAEAAGQILRQHSKFDVAGASWVSKFFDVPYKDVVKLVKAAVTPEVLATAKTRMGK